MRDAPDTVQTARLLGGCLLDVGHEGHDVVHLNIEEAARASPTVQKNGWDRNGWETSMSCPGRDQLVTTVPMKRQSGVLC